MDTENKPKEKPGRKTYDWADWRDRYVYSSLTLEQVSGLADAPSIAALKARSTKEGWASLRLKVIDRINTKARQIGETAAAEVRARHARLGKAMLTIAGKGLAHIEPEKLGDLGVSRLARVGAEIERKALGLETLTLRFEELSDEQLERIAAGEDPDKVLGD